MRWQSAWPHLEAGSALQLAGQRLEQSGLACAGGTQQQRQPPLHTSSLPSLLCRGLITIYILSHSFKMPVFSSHQTISSGWGALCHEQGDPTAGWCCTDARLVQPKTHEHFVSSLSLLACLPLAHFSWILICKLYFVHDLTSGYITWQY